MEPTAYAVLALHGDPNSAQAVERAYELVHSWQTEDGGWKPAAHINTATWVTALGVTICVVEEKYGRAFEQGVRWLLKSTGAENSLLSRIISLIPGKGIGRDISNRGWPWRADTTAWVEPTAHSLVALKKASSHFHDRDLQARVKEGEQLLLTVRGADGGWNYGSARALGVNLPSYPETTALAWLALQKRMPAGSELPAGRTQSRLADAWLGIVRRVSGAEALEGSPLEPPADLMIAALEALAAPGGNAAIFRT